MRILNIIIGLIYIIGDAIKNIILIALGIFQTFLLDNKKNNAFLELISRNCWIIGVIWFLTVFFIIGYFSIIVAFIVAFISMFFYSSFREDYLKGKGNYEGGWDVSASGIGMLLVVVLIVLNANSTPYTYTELGNYNLTKKDLFYTSFKTDENGTKTTKELNHRYVKLVVNNKIIKTSVSGCKEGTAIIYEESQKNAFVPWLTFLDVDYRAGCSNDMSNYKRVTKD